MVESSVDEVTSVNEVTSWLNLQWMGGGVGQKSYIAEIVSFSSRSFSHFNQI